MQAEKQRGMPNPCLLRLLGSDEDIKAKTYFIEKSRSDFFNIISNQSIYCINTKYTEIAYMDNCTPNLNFQLQLKHICLPNSAQTFRIFFIYAFIRHPWSVIAKIKTMFDLASVFSSELNGLSRQGWKQWPCFDLPISA